MMRTYIDILNEFVIGDFKGGGDDGNQTILISNIVWDVDDEEAKALPTRATTTLYDVEEDADPNDEDADLMSKVGQWLQANYDSRLSNFEYRII